MEDHNFCRSTKKTVYSQHGGFAEEVSADEVSVIPIPTGVKHEDAGPLLCGGITVFTPIVEFDINSSHKVGIIGIGGLGHLAIQFCKALGCHVTAFTSSSDKNDLLASLGADEIVSSTDKPSIDALGAQFDFLISTVNVKKRRTLRDEVDDELTFYHDSESSDQDHTNYAHRDTLLEFAFFYHKML